MQAQTKGLTHFWIRAIIPIGIDFYAFGVDGELETAIVIRADGEDVGHGPESVYDGSELLKCGKNDV